MPVELLKEKWSGKINAVTIGATKEQGGTRTSTVTIGGENTLPFMRFEGEMVNSPKMAMEIWDRQPPEWPKSLILPFEDVISSPVKWAKKCVETYKAEILFLRLQSAHPDFGNNSAEIVANTVKSVLEGVGVPLIIYGCGNAEKDNEILPKCTQIAKGENCLFGKATQDNYKTLTASCLADSHNIMAEAPIDVNIQKQVNILITEMGFPINKIVMDPTTGCLGYGLEYTYSVMERIRLAALNGDKMLFPPFICLVGQEVWKTKEVKASSSEFPKWGDENKRGPGWEMATCTSLLLAGANLLVVRHPETMEVIKRNIEILMK
ncbi:MAG: acetyl-CoA decarbonylase/synthase complex subunit delta [Candidatus Firestonebacteria bacterium]